MMRVNQVTQTTRCKFSTESKSINTTVKSTEIKSRGIKHSFSLQTTYDTIHPRQFDQTSEVWLRYIYHTIHLIRYVNLKKIQEPILSDGIWYINSQSPISTSQKAVLRNNKSMKSRYKKTTTDNTRKISTWTQ